MFLYVLLAVVALALVVSVAHPTLRRTWAFPIYAWKYVFLWLFEVVTRRRPRTSRPEFMRRFCEDMGPTYIKFGQIVASSSGMFPKRYSDEFQKCLDRVRPFAFPDVQRILQEELG